MRKKLDRRCLSCDAPLPTDKGVRKFCNNTCQNQYQTQQIIESWLSGEDDGMYKGKVKGVLRKPIRNYLIEKADKKCSRCQWDEINPTTGESPLEIDHIDGDPTNNRPENLKVLCPNCHSLTPTYKSLNSGMGRRGR